MRKMQLPAYCPVVLGVQAAEYKGVSVAVKKTIIMPCIDIIEPSIEPMAEPVSIVIPDIVDVAIFMPDIALVPVTIAMSVMVEDAMLIPDMSMLRSLVAGRFRLDR